MNDRLQGVVIGTAVSSVAFFLYSYLYYPATTISKSDSGSSIRPTTAPSDVTVSTAIEGPIADDDCFSLFYGTNPALNGAGFPSVRTVDSKAIQVMKTVHKVYTRLVSS